MGVAVLKCRDNGLETEALTGDGWKNTLLRDTDVSLSAGFSF